MTEQTRRRLGRTEIELSPVVMGCWQAGKNYWVGVRDEDIKEAVRASLDAGVNAFDTAEIYGNGVSERLLGEALRGRTEEARLLSKVWSANLRAQAVIEACEGSLSRLGVEALDLYQIHWPSGSWGSEEVPIEETMGAMLRLKEQGKIRAIGVSNFSRAQLEEAAAVGRIEAVQPAYSLFFPHAEGELFDYCLEHEISILAYSPLAQGLLTGRFDRRSSFEEGDPRRDNKLFEPEPMARAEEALKRLRPVAEEKGCTLAQLSLAWLVAQPAERPLTFALAGVRDAAQARDNAGAMGVTLSAEELAAIREIAEPVAAPFRGDPLLWNWQP
jgi:aryl-alcohol dehydrogenase-like predicted oxidoreductase